MPGAGVHRLPDEQSGREESDDEDESDKFPPAPLRILFVRRDVFRPFHPLRRHLEGPGDDERDRETEQGENDDRGRQAVGKVEGGDNRGRDLDDEPADDAIPDRNLGDVAPPEFREEASWIQG